MNIVLSKISIAELSHWLTNYLPSSLNGFDSRIPLQKTSGEIGNRTVEVKTYHLYARGRIPPCRLIIAG